MNWPTVCLNLTFSSSKYTWRPFLCDFQKKVLTLWRRAAFRDFRKKMPKRTWFCTGICPVCTTDPVKVSKDAASLLVCTWKKFFAWGLRVFCEWRHKWTTFRPPWPTLPGPGLQPLSGSILLKFLLETRLQSESFDTLDDLLWFRVQKLWCKLVKIYD